MRSREVEANYNIDENFNYGSSCISMDLDALGKKLEEVFERKNEISVFKLYMSMNQTLGINPKLEVRHNNTFYSSYCYNHVTTDKPFAIYDSEAFCTCYGCNKNMTVLDLIQHFIDEVQIDGKEISGKYGLPYELAIEVAHAFISGVKFTYREGCDRYFIKEKPLCYKFVNDTNLIGWLLDKIFKNYDSEIAKKYLEESAKKTEEQDKRISNYINNYGIKIDYHMARRLRLSKDYIKSRLYGRHLNDKLSISRLKELASELGKKDRKESEVLPFIDGFYTEEEKEPTQKNKKVIITFYENDQYLLELNSTAMGKCLNELSQPSSCIKDLKSEGDKKTCLEYEFSLSTCDSPIDVVIKYCLAKSTKDIIYSSVYEKELNPDSNVLTVIGGSCDSGKFYDPDTFPSQYEQLTIETLEESNIPILYANNSFRVDDIHASLYLIMRPRGEARRPSYLSRLYCSDVDWEKLGDRRLIGFLYGLSASIDAHYRNLGEVLFKAIYPNAWNEYRNKKQKQLGRQRV